MAILTQKPQGRATTTKKSSLLLPHNSNGIIKRAQTRKTTTSNNKFSFPSKLYELLETAEHDNELCEIISWLPEGDAFKVHKPDLFTESPIIRTHFRSQTRFKSFIRQLYLYGFSKIPAGPLAGAFAHPQFVRCNKYSCYLLSRNQSQDRRFKQCYGQDNNSTYYNFLTPPQGPLAPHHSTSFSSEILTIMNPYEPQRIGPAEEHAASVDYPPNDSSCSFPETRLVFDSNDFDERITSVASLSSPVFRQFQHPQQSTRNSNTSLAIATVVDNILASWGKDDFEPTPIQEMIMRE